MFGAPEVLRTLADRFDATAFDAPHGSARLRLRVVGESDWDATVEHGLMRLSPANGERPDARLAATSGLEGPERLQLGRVRTGIGEIATLQAGSGDDVLLLHGLGATKASFLPTVAALAGEFRVTAIDLPGFGDSAMPVGAPYDP